MTKEVKQINTDLMDNQEEHKYSPIPGLSGLPTSFIAIPKVRLVQSNSKNTTLRDGKSRARDGVFYYESLQDTRDMVRMSILAVNIYTYTGPSMENPGVQETKQYVDVLFLDHDYNKPFILKGIGKGSFNNWQVLMARLHAIFENGDLVGSFQYVIEITSELVSNPPKSYYQMVFHIAEKLEGTEFDTVAALFGRYGDYFDRQNMLGDEVIEG